MNHDRENRRSFRGRFRSHYRNQAHPLGITPTTDAGRLLGKQDCAAKQLAAVTREIGIASDARVYVQGWTRGMKIVKSTRIFPYLRRNCEKRFAEHELPSIKSANNFRRRGILRRIVSFSFYAIEQINSRSIMMVFSV